MNDDLKRRFDELRGEESRRIPPFAVRPRIRRFAYRWVFALLLLILIIAIRPQRTTAFTVADREAARSITTWHPPTDFLLKGAIR
jgi:hypothetical protein